MNLPAPKSNEFVSRINALNAAEGDQSDAWKELLWEIKVLKRTDAPIAWSLEGSVYACMRKSEDAIYAFENATKLAKNNYIVRHNYSAALAELGFYQRAFVQASEAYRLTEGAPGDAKTTFDMAWDAGEFAAAKHWLEVARKLNADIGIEAASCVQNAANFAAHRNWSDALISGYVEAALSVFRAVGKRIRPQVSFGRDDGEGFVEYAMYLKEPQSVVGKLNREWRERAIDLNVPVSVLTDFAISARSELVDADEA